MDEVEIVTEDGIVYCDPKHEPLPVPNGGNHGGGGGNHKGERINASQRKPPLDFLQIWNDAITQNDIKTALDALRDCVEARHPWAVQYFLNRVLGNPATKLDARVVSAVITPEEREKLINDALNLK